MYSLSALNMGIKLWFFFSSLFDDHALVDRVLLNGIRKIKLKFVFSILQMLFVTNSITWVEFTFISLCLYMIRNLLAQMPNHDEHFRNNSILLSRSVANP